MQYELRFQDGSATATRYLYEEVVALLSHPEVQEVEGIFAFATEGGVVGLVEDPSFASLMARGGQFAILVGLDAITDDGALLALRRAESAHPMQVRARAFKSQQRGLFHPKLVRARADNGAGVLIVGSGNLTPGGLRHNVEAYSVLRYGAHEVPDQTDWDRFITDHAGEISGIDADAIERGARNRERVQLGRRVARRTARGARRPLPATADEIAAATEELAQEVVPAGDRVLIAAVPRASRRWHQVHFNRAAVEQYFRAKPNSADRIFLSRLEGGQVIAEPPRPVVYSAVNVNHKIELGARAGAAYPEAPPIVVMRETGVRQHLYVMLFPGEPGYAEMTAFLVGRQAIGPGAPRAIGTHGEVATAWPAVPI